VKVKELIEELKKVPEEYLDYTLGVLDLNVFDSEGKVVYTFKTGIESVELEDEPAPKPEQPPKYYNDGTMFFDRFLRGVQ
jgi:hypothetical protein